MAPHSGKRRSGDISPSDGNKRAKGEEASEASQEAGNSSQPSGTDGVDPMASMSQKSASKVGVAREKPIPVTVLSGFLGAGEYELFICVPISWYMHCERSAVTHRHSFITFR
jgi:hypothetical protein